MDLACGPGAITELILSTAVERSRGLVYAVDPSRSELDRARRRITSGLVRFIHGSAENLSRLVPQVDAVIFCNAIHLVADKRCALDEIRKVLGPGGTLGFNTTFFKGCYAPGTERFYRYWILRAAQCLRERGVSVRRTSKAQAMQWFSPEEYGALVAASGFVGSSWQLQEVKLPPESLEDIAQFSMFIEGALPGVPLDSVPRHCDGPPGWPCTMRTSETWSRGTGCNFSLEYRPQKRRDTDQTFLNYLEGISRDNRRDDGVVQDEAQREFGQ